MPRSQSGGASLLPLLLAGSTVEQLRELIEVTSRLKRVLRAYAQMHAEDAYWIERILAYRSKVLKQFDRLVRERAPIPALPEVDEPESDAEGNLRRRVSMTHGNDLFVLV